MKVTFSDRLTTQESVRKRRGITKKEMKILSYNYSSGEYFTEELPLEAKIFQIEIFGEKCFYYPVHVQWGRTFYQIRHLETGIFIADFVGNKDVLSKVEKYWVMYGKKSGEFYDEKWFKSTIAKGKLIAAHISFPINVVIGR